PKFTNTAHLEFRFDNFGQVTQTMGSYPPQPVNTIGMSNALGETSLCVSAACYSSEFVLTIIDIDWNNVGFKIREGEPISPYHPVRSIIPRAQDAISGATGFISK